MGQRGFTRCLLVLLLVLVSRGTATQQTDAATGNVQGYDCNDLMSEQEIDRIVGLSGTVVLGSARGDENDVLPGHTECGYELPDDMLLTISVYSGAGFGEALETFDVVWTAAQSQGAEPLPEMGVGALLQLDFPTGPRILARAQGLGIVVGASDPEGLDKHDLTEVIRRVLALVVERLQPE